MFLFLFQLPWKINWKKCLDLCQRVFLCFPLKVLQYLVLHLVHVEFIFVYGVKKCSNFIFTCISPIFPTLLVKKTIFPVLYSFAPLVIELTIGLCSHPRPPPRAFFPVPMIYISSFVLFCFFCLKNPESVEALAILFILRLWY